MSKLETNQVDPATGTTLTLGTSGDTIAIPSGVTIANSGTATGFGGTNTPNFSAMASGSQTISTSTNTVLTFANELYDTDSAYDGTNKFTVPSGKAGKYIFNGNARIDSMYDGDDVILGFMKNGSTDLGDEDYSSITRQTMAEDNGSVYFGITAQVNCAVSDYIQMSIYHTRGSDRTTTANYTRFSGYKLIE